MAMCWNVIRGDMGPRLCGQPLTRENVRRGHTLCDVCSGRREVNERLSAYRRPVVRVGGYEQLELFP